MSNAFDIYCALDGALDGSVTNDERMARHVTYRIGGPADLFIECASLADLKLAVDTLREAGMRYTIIGKGSNLLVCDKGVRGAVIVLGRDFKKMTITDDEVIVAGGGVPLSTIVQDAFKQGYSGFEFAVGIPGTLGGALYMNAGTKTEWIGSCVESVTVLDTVSGQLRRISGYEIPWQYRRGNIARDEVILEAEMRMKRGDVQQIRAKMEASLDRRKKTQPLSYPSAGSTFRNPEDGPSAGRLIEEAGLKGTQIGDAQISELHANFIINKGNATAQNVVDLIVLARDRVEEVHGIELQPEVRFLGFE